MHKKYIKFAQKSEDVHKSVFYLSHCGSDAVICKNWASQ
jgi:hypothetical protein